MATLCYYYDKRMVDRKSILKCEDWRSLFDTADSIFMDDQSYLQYFSSNFKWLKTRSSYVMHRITIPSDDWKFCEDGYIHFMYNGILYRNKVVCFRTNIIKPGVNYYFGKPWSELKY